MAIIFGLFLWIVWDVVFSVYAELTVHKLTAPEWILAGSGILFAVLAMIFEFRERERQSSNAASTSEAHLREMAALNERLAVSDAKVETRFNIITQLGVESVQRLQEVTHTTRQRITIANNNNSIKAIDRDLVNNTKLSMTYARIGTSSKNTSLTIDTRYQPMECGCGRSEDGVDVGM
jgi:hypothetical protein